MQSFPISFHPGRYFRYFIAGAEVRHIAITQVNSGGIGLIVYAQDE